MSTQPEPAMAADRALALLHRDDDQPCGCDECMAYGAEDEGFDWYRIAPARRIVLRVLDSGDDRFEAIVTAFREHEESDSAPDVVPGLAAALRKTGAVRGIASRYGKFNDVYYDEFASALLAALGNRA